MREFVTVAEAAAKLQVAPGTVYRWIDAGRLPSFTPSDRVLVVRWADVLKVEATVKRGRPRGMS